MHDEVGIQRQGRFDSAVWQQEVIMSRDVESAKEGNDAFSMKNWQCSFPFRLLGFHNDRGFLTSDMRYDDI